MNVTDKLVHGLQVGAELHKDFEIRASNVGDMIDAEADAPVDRRLAFRTALLGRQIVRLGTLSGPIDFKLLRGLHPVDLDILSQAQQKVDAEGNAEPSS